MRPYYENEENRLSRQNTPSIPHEPKKLTKLPDPPIFEGKDTSSSMEVIVYDLESLVSGNRRQQRLIDQVSVDEEFRKLLRSMK